MTKKPLTFKEEFEKLEKEHQMMLRAYGELQRDHVEMSESYDRLINISNTMRDRLLTILKELNQHENRN